MQRGRKAVYDDFTEDRELNTRLVREPDSIEEPPT